MDGRRRGEERGEIKGKYWTVMQGVCIEEGKRAGDWAGRGSGWRIQGKQPGLESVVLAFNL